MFRKQRLTQDELDLGLTSAPKPAGWLTRRRQQWRDGAMRRAQRKAKALNNLARTCKFAIPVVGATLIAYGAYGIFPPAGFIVGGLLCFVIEFRLDGEGDGR